MADQYSVLICLLLTNDTRVVLKRKFCFVEESFALKKKVIFKINFCFINDISMFIRESFVSPKESFVS